MRKIVGIALAFILGAVTLPPALVIGAQAYQAVNGSAVTSTSTLKGGNGTAAAPTFSFSSDPDTGVYRVGANSLGISAAGSGVATFASTGTTVGPLTATSLTLGSGSTLSTYAKGTWTPADGSGAGLTYTVYANRYTRIGDTVIANMYISMPITASGATWKICGLPATAFAGSGYAGAYGGFIQYTDANLAQLNVQVQQNTACITASTGAAGAAVTNANMSGKGIGVTVIYEAQ